MRSLLIFILFALSIPMLNAQIKDKRKSDRKTVTKVRPNIPKDNVRLYTQILTPQPVAGRYLVCLWSKDGITPAIRTTLYNYQLQRNQNYNLKAASRNANLQKIMEVRAISGLNLSASSVHNIYTDVIVGFSANLTAAQVALLKADNRVMGVYQDYELYLSAEVDELKPDLNDAQEVPCAVEKAGGPAPANSVNPNSWIWFFDTGMDMDHEDLNVKPAPFAASVIKGETVEDLNGHGTHLAGIAAAKDNGVGIVGVAPGAWVVPVKVMDKNGKGSISELIAGLDHASKYASPSDIFTIGVAAYGFADCSNSNPMIKLVYENLYLSGIDVFIPAGNHSKNAKEALPGCFYFQDRRIYTVAAVDCDLNCAAYSNFDNNVKGAAVGTKVTSTYKNGTYATLSGTSISAAVAAGVMQTTKATGNVYLRSSVNCAGRTYKLFSR